MNVFTPSVLLSGQGRRSFSNISLTVACLIVLPLFTRLPVRQTVSRRTVAAAAVAAAAASLPLKQSRNSDLILALGGKSSGVPTMRDVT